MNRYNLFLYGKNVFTGTGKECARFIKKQDKLIDSSEYSIIGRIRQVSDCANRSIYGYKVRSVS